MESASLPCDIVLLPATELAKTAIMLSEHLNKFNTLFTLKIGRFYPHASLYMMQLRVADLDRVKALLTEIAGRTPELDLSTSGYYQADGYIDANYNRVESLDQLQSEVIAAINPIRDGMREKDKARMMEATGKVRENLEQYGYRGVGELFRPHMTLTRFADGQAIDTSSLPDAHVLDGMFTKLGVFEMGNNGTWTRKIFELNLAH